MRVSEVSKRYAKALLAVTKQKGIHTKALAEVNVLASAFSDSAVKNYFSNPMISTETKITSAKAALSGQGVSDEVMNTVLVLGEKGRLDIIPDVALALRDLIDAEEGLTRGVVRSAQPLSEDAQKAIEDKISKILNKKIVLTYEQAPQLLGGVVAQVGGWTFDDSIDTHLKKLNEELNRRAN